MVLKISYCNVQGQREKSDQNNLKQKQLTGSNSNHIVLNNGSELVYLE